MLCLNVYAVFYTTQLSASMYNLQVILEGSSAIDDISLTPGCSLFIGPFPADTSVTTLTPPSSTGQFHQLSQVSQANLNISIT